MHDIRAQRNTSVRIGALPLAEARYGAGVASEAPGPSPATHSQTLDRGLRALEVLAEQPDGMTVSELAAALGTHRAGVYRLLGPLVDHHLAVRARRRALRRWPPA